MFHAAMVALQCEWYGDWVPSKANVADYPSRGMDTELLDAFSF